MKKNKKLFKEKLDFIQSFKRYSEGETVYGLGKKIRMRPSEIVTINLNENFFIPKEKITRFLNEVLKGYDPRLYPRREDEEELERALGIYLNVAKECVVLGNGSDQLIDLITWLFLEKGDEALSIEPTFSMYKNRVDLQGAKYLGIPLKKDFTLDIERILSAITNKTKVLFLCSPNNPTANQFRREEILSLIEGFQEIVVIDEAYVEFAKYSVACFVKEFENLIVLRTFSKAFGLAGLRLGYAISNPEFVSASLKRIELPFNLSSFNLKMGLKLLSNTELVKDSVAKLKLERRRFIKELNSVNGVEAFDSQTNFVLFKTEQASNDVYQALLEQGILIRNVGKILHLDGCLRTTIGLPETNNKLLTALEQICGGKNV